MSQQLISRNNDLKRLRDDGFDVEIRSTFLLVKNVPYVNSRKAIARGTLVSVLDLAGDVTKAPETHVAKFIGEHPCNADGSRIRQIEHGSADEKLAEGLIVNHSFSAKPKPNDQYSNYHEKMTTYVSIISGPARAIDPSTTAKIFPVIETADGECVFNYLDTASSRAGIHALTQKLELKKVAIVGLGGTGSYVLDLVAKTPVGQIHLFDRDTFSNHNAFRSPGAPSKDELRRNQPKVIYFQERYSKMHRGIVPHECFIDAFTVEQLHGMEFVFLCLDRGGHKRLIVERLEGWGISFVDVGMGIELVDDSLRGVVRTTTSTPAKRDHVRAKVQLNDADGNDEYSRNIQIAELNALNAALAVVKWKKLFGFYQDEEREHSSVYVVAGNALVSEDSP